MLRIIGVIMTFFFFSASGFLVSQQLSARVKKLCRADRMLTGIIAMVYHQNLPTDEILFRLRQEGYSVGQSLSAAEAARVFAADSYFRKEEREILLRVGELLGTLDRESQCARLELEREGLRQLLREAEKEKETRGKLYRSAGVLLGALTAILAI